MAFAETTTVAFEKSIAEIIGLVRKAGAIQIGQMEGEDSFTVAFKLKERLIKFTLPLPGMSAVPKLNGRHQTLSAAQRQERLDQLRRSKARALLLVIKAKLESVESGIETVEEAFLANVVMSDGQTVYERIEAPVRLEYESGTIGTGNWLLPPPEKR